MKIIIKILIIVITLLLLINFYIVLTTRKQIIKKNKIDLTDIDCILVLGASAKKTNQVLC